MESKTSGKYSLKTMQYVGYIILLFLIVSYFTQIHFEKASDAFLPVATLVSVLVIGYALFGAKQKLKFEVSRIYLGLIFIYSGLVKAVDPLGTEYKLTDYFNDAFDMHWLSPYALALAVLLCASELAVGLSFFFHVKIRTGAFGAIVFMVIFTPITLYIALYNPVSDCGCFGEGLILTNWETFWKNIIIDIFLLFLLVQMKFRHSVKNKKYDFALASVIIVLSAGFTIYNTNHLPIVDFRPYHIGAHLPSGMVMPEGKQPDIYGYEYTMQKKGTNKIKIVDSDTYVKENIWKDTTWQIIETSESKLIKKGYTPPIHDLSIQTIEPYEISGVPKGTDLLESALNDSEFSFWLVGYDLEKSSVEGLVGANQFHDFAIKKGYNFFCLTATAYENVQKYVQNHGLKYTFYNTDPITLKTVVRSNPGLVLLKNGIVLGKWHHNDYPTIDELDKYILQAR